MDKLFASLRTFGVLLGLWVILAVVGIVTGVVPLGSGSTVDIGEADDPGDTDGSDGGLTEGDAGAATEVDDTSVAANAPTEPAADTAAADIAADTNTDTAAADTAAADTAAADTAAADTAAADTTAADTAANTDTDPPTAPPSALSAAHLEDGQRWSVCASSFEPSLSVADVFGDARPEILVGCADGWHVLGVGPSGPSRIAVFAISAAPSGQRAVAGPAGHGDVNGDGSPDLVLPLAFSTDSGASRGGGLYLVPRDSYGGIREPATLAPITAVSVALGPLDGTRGAEIVAMNRANALAQLPSEAWVFSGGGAPTRAAALLTGLHGGPVGIADVDRDGHADVIAVGRSRVDLHFGDGDAAFERSHTLNLEGARELGLGDLDGDGGTDLVVLGERLQWIRAGSLEGMEPHGVDGVPATLRGLQVLDADGDGSLDMLGWDHPRLVLLRQRGAVDFEPRTAFTLAGAAFGPRRHVVADLDSDGRADDLVLLGTSAEANARVEVIVVLDALSGSELTSTASARSVPDAPLVLRATLR